MKKFDKIIGVGMLLFAIGFNLWLYRLEPTVTTDPNDNAFQFALVNRENQIWDIAWKTKNPALLFDHWVPNWAEGYNLPYYYSHIPQIVIVALWRMLPTGMSLFTFYHWIIYLLLCFFPLSVLLALRIIGMDWLTAGIGAIASTQLSTDGLYGMDPSSFLWRGYGLSSQLFAMIFLPLSLAYAWRGKERPAILTLVATTAGHLGIGIIGFLSVAIIGLRHIRKLPIIFIGALLILGYWIIPAYLQTNYHNFSVWDPIWKFNSYGAIDVLKKFFNGELFDFGRLPILTLLTFVGLFSALKASSDENFRRTTNELRVQENFHLEPRNYFPFALLFVFWLLMFFGRTTWGSTIDLIPGMKEFHLSRFIVGVQMSGLFLISLAVGWVQKFFSKKRFVYWIICALVLLGLFPQTIRYAAFNDSLIKRANANEALVRSDVQTLFQTLGELEKTKPGRVFAGRGGSWGRDFRVAETPYYMMLSTYGFPTVLWLPQTWSPNSDTEQYFSENRPEDYTLYNIRYVLTPPTQEAQSFWKLRAETRSWKLYEVQTTGYMTAGIEPAVVSSSKENYLNVVRLWIQSDYPKQGLYPELTFNKNYPRDYGLPNVRMTDEVTYKTPDGTLHSLFGEAPKYMSQNTEKDIKTYTTVQVISQSDSADMTFSEKINVPTNCSNCLVILRESFHPSWSVRVDGKSVKPFAVFPFYTAFPAPEPGMHEVVFSYQPSTTKMVFLTISLLSLIWLLIGFVRVKK